MRMNDFVSAVRKILFAVFTKRCEMCGKVIELDSKFCDDCITLPVISSPRCPSCGCAKTDCSCKKNKNEYKQIVAPYYYSDSIVTAVHSFKDGDMPFLSKRFCADMAESVRMCCGDIEFDLITFVPLRKFKALKRGYNQSELLSEGLSKLLDIRSASILKKVRYTGVQHHKSAVERKASVFGAYDVKDEYKGSLEGKTILLVDDVKTTGSTLNECAKMLNIYDAKAVYAVTFALTKKKS